mgnify:CR=1 FL=1
MKSYTYHYFFTKLANPLKIMIITSLKEKDKSVTELSKELEVEQSKISHALSNLKSCNIVNFNQDGKKRVYSLNKETIVPMLKLIDKHARIFCKNNCIAKNKESCRCCGE